METTIAIPPAFLAATKQLHYQPPDLAAFWFAWVKHATPRNVRRDVLGIMIEIFPGYVRVSVFGGIAAVASDGFIRAFAPVDLLKAEPVDLGAIRAWLTTAGYVSEPCRLNEQDEHGKVRVDTDPIGR